MRKYTRSERHAKLVRKEEREKAYRRNVSPAGMILRLSVFRKMRYSGRVGYSRHTRLIKAMNKEFGHDSWKRYRKTPDMLEMERNIVIG